MKRSLKRQALTKPNLAYFCWRYLGNGGRTLKAWRRKPAHDDASQIAEALSEQGIVVGPADQYLDKEGREALVEASDLVLGISAKTKVTEKGFKGSKDYLVQLIPWEYEHEPDSPLLRLALDNKLLEIVSLYLGMWPRLHAVGAWLNLPSADAPKQAQLWHRDPEDIKIVKAFIYLADVGQDTGPFTYIPRTHPFGAGAATVPKHADPKRITDAEMRATIPPEAWVTCTGPKNTMILADTVGYHRGGKPSVGKRILITFTYTSGTPLVKRGLHIKGKSNWLNTAIQRQAL